MKIRIKKRRIYSRGELPKQFVRDTLKALAEVKVGKYPLYQFGPIISRTETSDADVMAALAHRRKTIEPVLTYLQDK